MQKNFEELSLKEYNGLLASDAPAPGGGSALCQVAAIACSLIEMAVNVTAAKPVAEENREFLLGQCEAVTRAKKAFFRLSNDDAAAFQRIADGFKLPKTTEEERKVRSAELQKAYHRAALVPLDVMGLCREIIRLTEVRILPNLSRYVASDCTIALDLLRNAIRNSLLNVQANTALIRDADLAARLDRQAAQIAEEIK